MKAITKIKKAVKEAKASKPVSAKETKKDKELELDLETSETKENVAASAPLSEPKADVEDKVGSMLKAARLKKELEIADVSKLLCIRRVYLEAIENSDYDEIPDFPYGPGFVRSYADFLGLNGARLVQVFKDETDAKNKSAKSYYVPEPQVEVVTPNRKYLLISLICIIVIYLGWVIYARSTVTDEIVETSAYTAEYAPSDEQEAPLSMEDFTEITTDLTPAEEIAVEDNLPVVDVSNTAAETPQVTVSEESFVEDVPTVQPVVETPAGPSKGVFLKIKQETWVAVQDSEKLYLSKVLKEGDTYTVPNGGKNMKLSVGRLGAVDVYIDGKVTDVVTASKKTNIDLNQFLAQ